VPQVAPLAEEVEMQYRKYQDEAQRAFRLPPELMHSVSESESEQVPAPVVISVSIHQARLRAAKRAKAYLENIHANKPAAQVVRRVSGLKFGVPVFKYRIPFDANSQNVQPTVRRALIPTFA
jgi:hypothetical protein